MNAEEIIKKLLPKKYYKTYAKIIHKIKITPTNPVFICTNSNKN